MTYNNNVIVMKRKIAERSGRGLFSCTA